MLRGMLVLGVFLCPIGTSGATTIFVPDDYPTIQGAIDSAVDGDTIIVRPGTYIENIDFTGKAICVQSEMGSAVTIINGNKSGSVVTFQSGETLDSVLEGFTITNGTGTYIGTFYIGYCGGGIFCSTYSSPTIKNNIIIKNSVDHAGGGICCWVESSPDIVNNVISRNMASIDGAGISCLYGSAPTIMKNAIFENYASCSGGGIHCWVLSSPTVSNNRIFKNFSNGSGGGMHILDFSHPIIANNIFYKNRAKGGEGGAINCWSSYPIVVNSIIWNNTAPNGPQISPSYTAASFCDIEGGWLGTGNIDADPLFADAANNDFHLTWPSPCRNTGDNMAVTELYDFEGDPRIHNGTVDIGADEFYFHLYHIGDVVPGGNIDVKVVGGPAMPVHIETSSFTLDPPVSTQYGILYMPPPYSHFSYGNIPSNGVLNYPATIPPTWMSGDQYFAQALVGSIGNPNSALTNLMVLTVE